MDLKKISGKLLLCLALMQLLASCSSTKNIASEEIIPMNTSRIMRKMLSESPRYQTYSSKRMNVEFSFDGVKNSVSGSFQVERDKRIFMNVRKMAFPIGKAIVTTDSVSIINYLQRSFMYGDISGIQAFLGDNVDYRLLQAILTADMRALTNEDLYNKELTSSIDGKMYRIDSQIKGKINKAIEKGKDRRLSRFMEKMDGDEFVDFSIWVDPVLFLVQKIELRNLKSNEVLRLSYGNYEKIQRQYFPCEVSFEYLSRDKNITLNLEIGKQTVNKRESINFTIPEKYKRIDIADL